ncbi:MAG: hypothetical protein H7A55_04895 [Verrucomicrobiaceae bacterium]|nr:hypothetical protein [Verrucomicrobiaceae bacterium]
MSNSNTVRDTPGRILLAWSVLFVSVVILAWRIHLHPNQYDWVEYPTALGDGAYYSRIGANDFFEPNLKFPGQEKGLYRRLHQPTRRNDARMTRMGPESTGRFNVYRDTDNRIFMKTGDDAYIEFGERLYYPPFKP